MIQTSAARRIVGSVSDTLVGGGFGQSRTAHHGPGVVHGRRLGEDRRDVPLVTHSEHDQIETLSPRRRCRRRQRRRHRRRRRIRRPTRPSRAPWPDRPERGRAAPPWPASRSGPDPSAGTKRSSPQKISTRLQSMASRAGESFSCTSSLMPTPPPVSATAGIRPVDWMSTSVVISRAAVAAASRSGVPWMTTSRWLTDDARGLAAPPTRRRLRVAGCARVVRAAGLPAVAGGSVGHRGRTAGRRGVVGDGRRIVHGRSGGGDLRAAARTGVARGFAGRCLRRGCRVGCRWLAPCLRAGLGAPRLVASRLGCRAGLAAAGFAAVPWRPRPPPAWPPGPCPWSAPRRRRHRRPGGAVPRTGSPAGHGGGARRAARAGWRP